MPGAKRGMLSIEEGEVLEDTVGIGVVDDAMCCDTLLFSSYTCLAYVCFWSYFAVACKGKW